MKTKQLKQTTQQSQNKPKREDTKYIFEGIYGVTTMDDTEAAPAFYDWMFLERPYINKVWQLRDQNYYVLVAFSGTPPNGQVLFLKAPWHIGSRLYEEQQERQEHLISAGIPHPLIVL